MKFWVLALLLSIPASAMERLSGWCERGGQTINVPPAVGQPPVLMNVMRNYPTCSVSVFITGSGGQYAQIYSNNAGQALTNPFQADMFGGWGFYVSNGTYDIQLSGGGLPAPYTLGAQSAFDSASFVPLVPFTNVTSGTSNGALVLAGSLTTTPSAIINFTQAAHTFPFLTGPTSIRPATCGVGEAFFATDAPAGQNLIGCTAANTWTQLGGTGGGGGFLPLSGGTMTGAITGAPIQGSIYIPYPGNLQMQVGPNTGQNPNCAPGFGNCPDATLVDYFGFEGTFIRVKGGGDYFDWTRWTSGQAALPLHQLALNDSSFNNLLLVDETAGYPQANFNFTGYVNATQQIRSNQGFLSSLYRNGNGQDYFDWTTTGLGQHAYDLRDSSNTPILSYRNTSASPGGGVFTFSGEVSTPPTSSVGFQAPLYRLNNGMDYFDWLSIGLGTHAFDLRDSGSNAILQYRNSTGSGLMGTYTLNGNLIINGTCTGCGTGGGGGVSIVMPTAPIVSNIAGATLNISCPTCLPTTGGTMTGRLTLETGCPTWCVGAAYLPYGGNLEMQPGPTTGQSMSCTAMPGQPAAVTCPDATLVDYFGFEGNFFRIKGGGDYFDFTRWTSGTAALPLHQLNLNNSSFVNLLNINDTFGTGMTQFNFTGFINSTLQIKTSQGVDAPIYKLDNTTDYFEWINTGLGAHHFQIQDSGSSVLLDYINTTGNPTNGTFTFDGNVTINGTCTGCGATGGGVNNVNPTAPIVASITGSTMSISCPTCGTSGNVTGIIGTANQVLANGMTGTPINGAVTLTLPQNLGTASQGVQFGGLCLNQTCNTDGYILQVNGGIEVIGQNTIFWKTCTVNNCVNAATGGVTSGTGYWVGTTPAQVIAANGSFVGTAVTASALIQTTVTGLTQAFAAGGGAFEVLGSGSIRGSSMNVTGGGTYQFNASPALRYTGTVPSGNVQFSNDGGTTWTNLGGGGAGGVTSVTQGTGISVSPTTGAVVVTNTGVLSVTGSANMVNVSGATGNVTFTLPQAIATGSVPQFGGLTLNQGNDNSGYQLQVNGGIEMASTTGAILSKGTATNAINSAGGVTSTTGYWIGPFQQISSANGGQFVGGGGINTNGTITSQNFIQSGSQGFYVATTQVISNAGGGQFVGPGGVFTSGSVVANAVGTGTSFNVGSSTGITRNIVTGSCTINVTGGVITGSSGC